MEPRGEGGAQETLLEMGSINNFHSNKPRDTMVQMKRMQAETTMLHDDRSPEDPEDNAMETNLNGSANGNDTYDDYRDDDDDNNRGGGNNGDNGDDDDSDSSSDLESVDSHSVDPNSCKGKLVEFLKTNLVQYFIIALVIADCLIIVLELLIDMEFIVFPEDPPPSYNNSAASHPDAYASHSSTQEPHISNPNHHDPHHYDPHQSLDAWANEVNSSWFNNSLHGNFSHEQHHHDHHTNKEKAEHILHALSLAILSIFMVEVCLKIFIEGKHLLKQKAEVFDAVVVIVSFTLDITFSFVSVESAAKDAAGLMVLLRLWRVTRIINGVILSVKLDAKKKMDAQKKILRQLEHENKRQKSRIEKLERENAALKSKLGLLNDNSSVGTNKTAQSKNNSVRNERIPEVTVNDYGENT